MATEGRTRTRRLIAGFVAAAVAGLAVAGVLLVRDRGRDPAPGAITREEGLPAVTARREGAVPPPAAAEPDVSPPSRPVSEAGSPQATFTLQIGSYRTQGKAASVLREAESASGLPGEIVAAGSDDDRWYRILLGTFASEDEARARGEDLVRARILDESRVRRRPSP